MTIFTEVAGRDVRGRLARSGHAVMTTAAVADNANVIKVCGHPTSRRMAVVTGVATRHMRRRLAGSGYAIVAGATGANDLGVINHGGRQPRDHAVAVFANGSGLDVSWVFAGCVRAVVAARTVACDVDVIEIRRNPIRGRMTVVAGFATRDVCRCFPSRDVAVVA